jgi:hypothetical protein
MAIMEAYGSEENFSPESKSTGSKLSVEELSRFIDRYDHPTKPQLLADTVAVYSGLAIEVAKDTAAPVAVVAALALPGSALASNMQTSSHLGSSRSPEKIALIDTSHKLSTHPDISVDTHQASSANQSGITYISETVEPGDTIWQDDAQAEQAGDAAYPIMAEVAATNQASGSNQTAQARHETVELVDQDLQVKSVVKIPVLRSRDHQTVETHPTDTGGQRDVETVVIPDKTWLLNEIRKYGMTEQEYWDLNPDTNPANGGNPNLIIAGKTERVYENVPSMPSAAGTKEATHSTSTSTSSSKVDKNTSQPTTTSGGSGIVPTAKKTSLAKSTTTAQPPTATSPTNSTTPSAAKPTTTTKAGTAAPASGGIETTGGSKTSGELVPIKRAHAANHPKDSVRFNLPDHHKQVDKHGGAEAKHHGTKPKHPHTMVDHHKEHHPRHNPTGAVHGIVTHLIGSSPEQQVFNYWYIQRGESKAFAAGATANAEAEHNFSSTDDEGGLGTYQETGNRATALVDYAENVEHTSPYSLTADLNYAYCELTDCKYAGSDEGTVMWYLKHKDKSVVAATVRWMGTTSAGGDIDGYEDPGIPHMQTRIDYAEQIIQKFGHESRPAVGALQPVGQPTSNPAGLSSHEHAHDGHADRSDAHHQTSHYGHRIVHHVLHPHHSTKPHHGVAKHARAVRAIDSATSGDAEQLAQKILNNPNVNTSFDPSVRQDLEDAAAGKPGTAGAMTKTPLLRLIETLGEKEEVGISAIQSDGAGHCGDKPESICPDDPHYLGDAVDFVSLGGLPVLGRNAASIAIIEEAIKILPSGSDFGQDNCGGDEFITNAQFPNGDGTFSDTCTHLHVQVPETAVSAPAPAQPASPAATSHHENAHHGEHKVTRHVHAHLGHIAHKTFHVRSNSNGHESHTTSTVPPSNTSSTSHANSGTHRHHTSTASTAHHASAAAPPASHYSHIGGNHPNHTLAKPQGHKHSHL